jgi:uncharacterized protein (UPF0333 family)
MYCQVDREACCSLAVSIIIIIIIIIIVIVLLHVCEEMDSNDFVLCVLVYDTEDSHRVPACIC